MSSTKPTRMSTAIDLLKKVKTILGMDVKLAQAKLKDGMLVSYDRMEVGGLVSEIATDGTTSSLASGDYLLEDGSTFTVGAAGTITAYVKAVTPTDKPTPTGKVDAKPNGQPTGAIDPSPAKAGLGLAADVTTAPDAPEAPAEDATPGDSTEIADLTARVSTLEQLVSDMQSAMMTANEANTEMANQLIEMSKQPGAESITKTPAIKAEPSEFQKFMAHRIAMRTGA